MRADAIRVLRAGWLLALTSAGVGAQALVPGWTGAADTVAASTHPAAVRQRAVRVDAAAFDGLAEGDRVVLELFDDVVVGVVDRRRDRRAGRYTVSGPVEGVPGASFAVARNDEALVGLVRLGAEGLFRLEVAADGQHRLAELDPTWSAEPCEVGSDVGLAPALRENEAGGATGPTAPGAPSGPALVTPDPCAGGSGPCPGGEVIDVLVVFTYQVIDFGAGSLGALEAALDLEFELNNIAYAKSGIASELNLVHASLLPWGETYQPSLSWLLDPDDGILDEVHGLRNAYGADLVVQLRTGGGGFAYGMSDFSDQRGSRAFASTGVDTLANSLALSHEVGHLLGCCHAPGDGGGCAPEGGLLFEYSNGYRFDGLSGTRWRTLMAYQGSPPATLTDHFSNPTVTFDGVATGTGAWLPDGADNALTINQSKAFVADYRKNDGICEGLDLASDAPDCNGNLIPDACDLALGTSVDENLNGIPDECEPGLAPWSDAGGALAGAGGEPRLEGSSWLVPGSRQVLHIRSAAPTAPAAVFLSQRSAPVPFLGGTLVAFPFADVRFVTTGPQGDAALEFVVPSGAVPGTELWVQCAIRDAGAPFEVALSNALHGVVR